MHLYSVLEEHMLWKSVMINLCYKEIDANQIYYPLQNTVYVNPAAKSNIAYAATSIWIRKS